MTVVLIVALAAACGAAIWFWRERHQVETLLRDLVRTGVPRVLQEHIRDESLKELEPVDRELRQLNDQVQQVVRFCQALEKMSFDTRESLVNDRQILRAAVQRQRVIERAMRFLAERLEVMQGRKLPSADQAQATPEEPAAAMVDAVLSEAIAPEIPVEGEDPESRGRRNE